MKEIKKKGRNERGKRKERKKEKKEGKEKRTEGKENRKGKGKDRQEPYGWLLGRLFFSHKPPRPLPFHQT